MVSLGEPRVTLLRAVCTLCACGRWPRGSGDRCGLRDVATDGFDVFGRGGLLFLGDSDLDLWSATSSSYFDTFPNSSSLAVGGYTCDDVLDDDIEDVLDEASPSTVRIHAPTYKRDTFLDNQLHAHVVQMAIGCLEC